MFTTMRVTKLLEIEVPGLGQRIKEARLDDRRSLKKICDAIPMSSVNWYRVEQEKQSLPIETLRRIEEVLGIDLGVIDPEEAGKTEADETIAPADSTEDIGN